MISPKCFIRFFKYKRFLKKLKGKFALKKQTRRFLAAGFA